MPCAVCLNRAARSYLMCELCGLSYDKMANRTSTIDEIIRWAASRARRYERARAKKKTR